MREHIQTRYKFGKTLGEGAYGKVKVASLHENPKKEFAIKSIPRSLIDKHGKDKTEETALKFNETNEPLEEGFDDEEAMQELL